MATWPAYKAGSARIVLKPALASTFKADTKTLLAPIKESLKVTVSPTLAKGFKADLRAQVKVAAEGIAQPVAFKPTLAPGFRTDLKALVKEAAKSGSGQKVTFTPALKAGFKTDLQTAVKAVLLDYLPKVRFAPKLAATFKTDLTAAVDTLLAGKKAHTVEFAPKLRAGFTADLKTAIGGVLSKIRSQAEIEFRPKLAKGFRTTLSSKVATSTGTLRPSVPVDVDVTQATAQLQAFRTAQAAIPLTMNVNVDTALATAQLMALRSLASAVGTQVGQIGSGLGSGGRGGLRGNIFTRPIRAIRLQIEIDRQSLARAEAEVANLSDRLANAQRVHGDAVDKTRLAWEKHEEVMNRATSTASQKTAAIQRLARARRDEADALGRVTGLMNEQREAENRLDRARDDQTGFRRIGRLASAGFTGLIGAIGSMATRMMSFRNITSLATIALVALAAVNLIPLLGQLSQALGVVGLLPAALMGAVSAGAALVVGFQGIGDAFTAAGKAFDNAADDAEAKAKNIASAQKAQASAARSVADAERGVASAEKSVRTAQKNTLQAQKDLNKARKQAKDDIDDLNRALGRTALTEETAAIAVAEARRDLFETFADPNSDSIDRARAQNSLKQALADQEDTRRDNQKLAEQAAEANAKGVEGSDVVIDAKERISEAVDSEAEAQQSLLDSYTRLADAQQSYVEAQQATVDAMNESSDSVKELEKALGKLSPAARTFVEKMQELRGPLGELRQFVQEKLFTELGTSVQDLALHWLPTLRDGLGGIAHEINEGVRRALADLDTEASRSKLSVIFDNVEKSIGPLINGLNNLLQGFLSLAQVGSEFMPSGAQGFEDMTKRFRTWSENPENQQKFRDFLSESIKTFDKVMEIGGKIIDLVKNLFSGSDQAGEDWLDSIANTLTKWNEFLSSEDGQKQMNEFFNDAKDFADSLYDAVVEIMKLMDRIDDWDISDKLDNSPLGGVLDLFDSEKSGGEKVAGLGKGLWGGLTTNSGIGMLIKGTQPGRDFVWDKVQEGWDSFVKDIEDEAGAVVGKLYEMGHGFSSWADLAEDALSTRVGGALTGFSTNLAGVSTSISEFGDDASDRFGIFKTKVSDIFAELTGPDVLGAFKSDMNGLPGFFDSLVNGIGSIWSKLSTKFAGPINTVIDVLNSFGDVWNKVASKLGLPTWDPIEHVQGVVGQSDGSPSKPLVGARWRGGPGGPVIGPGGGKEDKAGLYRLSNDEHVWTADEVRAAGGHEVMYQWRRSVLEGGGKQSHGDGYFNGGIVQTSDPLDPVQAQLWDLVREAIPSAVLTSAKRFVDVGSGFDYHMRGKAIDLGGPMPEIARWIYQNYPQSAELIHAPLDGWQNINDGQPFSYSPGTLAEHEDHVHWAAEDFLGPLTDEERKSFFDRVREGIGGMVNRGRAAVVENLLGRPLRALADQVPTFDSLGEFGQVPKAFAKKMVNEVINRALNGLGGGGSTGTGGLNYDSSGGAEQWRDLAMEAMRREGFNADDPRQVNAMLSQIQSESGGDPNILQKVIDVNSGGNEAQGLLQVIPGTFAAFRDPSLPNDRTDPLANMVAALRYYRATYGNDLTTFWGQGHGYDQGGILKHKGWGINMSGLPEAVLTNPQWQMFDRFVQSIPGFNNQLQALPQPLEGGTDANGNPGTYGVPKNPMVDTPETLWEKTQERFKGAWDTGFSDAWESNLGFLGIPNPTTIPLVEQVQAYGEDLDAWHKARIANAQASQALVDSGYQAAPSPANGAAATVAAASAGTPVINDNTTVINIHTADVNEAYRKAQQIKDVRALTTTARGGR